MKTIEEKMRLSKKWKDAEIRLENFNKIIELIKEYPPKLMQYPNPPQYELN